MDYRSLGCGRPDSARLSWKVAEVALYPTTVLPSGRNWRVSLNRAVHITSWVA